MPVRFTLEKRTNKFGECPIRLSWSFGGQRYQTTIGFSVKKEDWGKTQLLGNSDDIDHILRRINAVAEGLEEQFKTNKNDLSKDMMKQAISDILSGDIARPEDVIERCIEGTPTLPKPQTRYYRDGKGRYYRFICDAVHKYMTMDKYFILQELFGQQQCIVVPAREFQKVRETGQMYATSKYDEVSYDEVFGKKENA